MKSIKFPFTISSSGISYTKSPSKIAEQKIVDVLVTNRNERVGIIGYGASANSLLFEAVDELISADYKVDALAELRSRINGVDIIDMRIANGLTDETTVDITVYYRLPMSSLQTMTFTVYASALNEESKI